MFPRARPIIDVLRPGMLAVLLVCLAIRPVLLVAAPLHELEHVATDASPANDRVIGACEQRHAPGLHDLMQRHGVIVAAEVPLPALICAAVSGPVRFFCVDIRVPAGRYAGPFRPPIA